MNQEEKDAFMLQFPDLGTVRKYFLDQALEREQYDTAIGMLRESIELDSEYAGLVDEHYQQLIDLLRSLKREEELRSTLLEYVSDHRQRDLKYVLELKSVTKEEEWPALREKLLCESGVGPVSGELMVEEEQFRRLMDRILKTGNAWEMDRFAATLKENFPGEMLEFYLADLRRRMAEANSRKAYAGLVLRLKSLRSYPDGGVRTRELAEEWRSEYPRRRAMMDEMKQAGF